MKFGKYFAAALPICLALMHATAHAGATAARGGAAATDPWAGNWKDDRGGLAVVVAREGVLDMFGTDAASIYRAVCVLDAPSRQTATCAGDGVNHERGFRFVYRSQLRLGEAGTLTEEWEAQGPNVRLQGKAVFKRAAVEGAR
ncbi:MAG: hypothetical protein ING59_10995 [Burkholderiales bacterium]|jgi:hypothetical protein|nr:hypothetical protein [Burkholderiales bacterium]